MTSLRLELACGIGQRTRSCPLMRDMGVKAAGKLSPNHNALISTFEEGSYRSFFAQTGKLHLHERLAVAESVLYLNSADVLSATAYASDLNRMRRYEAALNVLKTIPEKYWTAYYFTDVASKALHGLERHDEASDFYKLGSTNDLNDLADACRRLSRIWPGVDVPLLDVSGRSFSIMKKAVTVGQFLSFVSSTGYVISGHNAERLETRLMKGSDEDVLRYLSLRDARALAKWLSWDGKNWRVPTFDELDMTNGMAKLDAGDQSDGDMEWTETAEGASNALYFRTNVPGSDNASLYYPDSRRDDFIVRLVVDK